MTNMQRFLVWAAMDSIGRGYARHGIIKPTITTDSADPVYRISDSASLTGRVGDQTDNQQGHAAPILSPTVVVGCNCFTVI